jgi:glycosyltransferase involved in cell wall biosynthesis
MHLILNTNLAKTEAILIVIPTLGERLDMLDECLESIFSQNCNVRVVLVFPKSKYSNMKVVQARFPRIVLEAQDLKFIPAVNYAIKNNPDCDYFTLICDDDLLANNCLQRSITELEINPKIVGVYGAIDYINQKGLSIGKWNPPIFAQKINSFIPSAIKVEGSLFRMSIIRQIGEIPEFIDWAVTDIYLILQVCRLGDLEKLKGPPVAKYRMHDDSTSNKYPYKVNYEGWKVQFKLGSVVEKFLVITLGPVLIFMKIGVLKLMLFKSRLKKRF